MDIETFHNHCLALPGANESFPFDADTLVFKVLGKMFAVLPLERADRAVLKLHPSLGSQLREEFAGDVSEAWHFNKTYWSEVRLGGRLTDERLLGLLRHSYGEVLRSMPKKAQVAHFASCLPDGFYYKHLNTTDTVMNLHRAEYVERPADFVLLETDFQKQGRGQRGTSWEADSARNLLFGLRLRPTFLPAASQFRLSQAAALAIAKALAVHVEGIRIKWPNDIYCGDEKICGMLLEHDLAGTRIRQSLIGPGINVNQPAFHSDAPNPTSLFRLLGREVNRYTLLLDVVERFLGYYEMLRNGQEAEIDATYHALLYRRDALHTYRDASGTFRGTLRRVLQDGRLVVEDEGGRERLYAFKEISYII